MALCLGGSDSWFLFRATIADDSFEVLVFCRFFETKKGGKRRLKRNGTKMDEKGGLVIAIIGNFEKQEQTQLGLRNGKPRKFGSSRKTPDYSALHGRDPYHVVYISMILLHRIVRKMESGAKFGANDLH